MIIRKKNFKDPRSKTEDRRPKIQDSTMVFDMRKDKGSRTSHKNIMLSCLN